MDQSRIVIIGANGQLSKALQRQYPKARVAGSGELDITNIVQVAAYDWSNVDIVINAAAYTNVDAAETSEGRRLAWLVNASGVSNLAAAASDYDLTLVHISSDYVFDGTVSEHLETESFTPLGVYGQTKAAGDIAASLTTKHYIIRTSWVIGEGKNFVQTMLGLGEKSISPGVVADQIGRLTFTIELTRAIDYLLTNGASYGTYNVSNSGDSVSWADITRTIFEQAGYALPVKDVSTADYYNQQAGPIAPRPLQSTLSLAKLQATGFTSTDWRNDLATYIYKEATT